MRRDAGWRPQADGALAATGRTGAPLAPFGRLAALSRRSERACVLSSLHPKHPNEPRLVLLVERDNVYDAEALAGGEVNLLTRLDQDRRRSPLRGRPRRANGACT